LQTSSTALAHWYVSAEQAGASQVWAATSHKAGVAHVCTVVQPVWFALQTWRLAPLHWYSPGEHGAVLHSPCDALHSAGLAQETIVVKPVSPALHVWRLPEASQLYCPG
jgi:hypothetical protein